MLAELIKKLEEAKRRKASLRESFEAEDKKISALIDDLRRSIELTKASIDLDKVTYAETLCSVGKVDSSTRRAALQDVIKEVAANRGSKYFKEYQGIKIYSGFGEQHSSHIYGYGPRHGSIVWSFELTRKLRERPDKFLNDEEVDAILYYLLNIESIQEKSNVDRT